MKLPYMFLQSSENVSQVIGLNLVWNYICNQLFGWPATAGKINMVVFIRCIDLIVKGQSIPLPGCSIGHNLQPHPMLMYETWAKLKHYTYTSNHLRIRFLSSKAVNIILIHSQVSVILINFLWVGYLTLWNSDILMATSCHANHFCEVVQ